MPTIRNFTSTTWLPRHPQTLRFSCNRTSTSYRTSRGCWLTHSRRWSLIWRSPRTARPLAGIGSSQHCLEVSKIEIGVRRGGGDLIEPFPDHGEGVSSGGGRCSDVMVTASSRRRSAPGGENRLAREDEAGRPDELRPRPADRAAHQPWTRYWSQELFRWARTTAGSRREPPKAPRG